MGYNTNRLDLTLADVVGTDESYRYSEQDHYDEPEPDEIIDWEPEDDYPDYDADEGLPEDDDVDDPNEIVLPHTQSVSVVHYGVHTRWYSKREKNRYRRTDRKRQKRSHRLHLIEEKHL